MIRRRLSHVSSYHLTDLHHCWFDRRYPCSTLEATYGCDCSACACGGGGEDGDDDCEDSDGGATDPYGDDCASYYNYPSWCSGYDDADFTSNEMCCVCGGGVEEDAPTPAPTPRPTTPTPAPSGRPTAPTPPPSEERCPDACFGTSCNYWTGYGYTCSVLEASLLSSSLSFSLYLSPSLTISLSLPSHNFLGFVHSVRAFSPSIALPSGPSMSSRPDALRLKLPRQSIHSARQPLTPIVSARARRCIYIYIYIYIGDVRLRLHRLHVRVAADARADATADRTHPEPERRHAPLRALVLRLHVRLLGRTRVS